MEKKTVLVLVSDAYGGRGGIALYNRNILKALSRKADIWKVIAIPRVISYPPENIPGNLEFMERAAGGKIRYLFVCIFFLFFRTRPDLILCTHIHLLPFAYLIRGFSKCPIVPIVYGVEAWKPTPHFSVNRLCRRLENLISIRKLTANRFIEWAGLRKGNFYYLPNCIDENNFRLGNKKKELVEKYGLEGKRVIMTAGRLDSNENDKLKGFDEVIEVLPELRKNFPDLIYMVCGDGGDKERLMEKANSLGVSDIVVFTGYVPEEKKADYFRLADVFAMPGSNPLFDRYPFRFVFLEALACGIPVVGSRVEDESEANDPLVKKILIQVDPENKEEIKWGILEAFKNGKEIKPELKNLTYPVFEAKLWGIIYSIMS